MDKMIEIRYAGVVVGRSSIVRELDTRGLFLGVAEPLPVGTTIELKVDDRLAPGRVELVAEASELARSGMRVRFARPGDASLFGNPSEAPPELEAPPALAAQSAVEAVPAAVEAVPAAVAPAAASGPRRIVVDASTEKPAQSEGDAAPGDAVDAGEANEADVAGADGAAEARLPAPDPAAFGNNGGGRKNRRNRRR